MRSTRNLSSRNEARKAVERGRTLHPNRYARLRPAPNKVWRDQLIVSADTGIIVNTVAGNRAVALLMAELDR